MIGKTLVCDDWRDEKHFKMSFPLGDPEAVYWAFSDAKSNFISI